LASKPTAATVCGECDFLLIVLYPHREGIRDALFKRGHLLKEKEIVVKTK
jgi:hypothetical protein